MTDDFVFTEPWWDLRTAAGPEAAQRRAMLDELAAEVKPGHPLHGIEIAVVARSTARDDVLVQLDTGRWAIVHLTWHGSAETPPWPGVTFYDTPSQVQAALRDDDAADP